jgi:DNA-directed RNA polymerase subunit M/transcription elongation factor TFIIS
MSRCPKCGSEVLKAKKAWKMVGRPDQTGAITQLEIGLFECPKCKGTFRVVLNKTKTGSNQRPMTQSVSNCKSCGNDNPIEYQFCGKCGSNLKGDETKVY